MGDYERQLMAELDKMDEDLDKARRKSKKMFESGTGCYSTRGSGEQDEDIWN